MSQPTISAIAAIGNNRELGKDNGLIWRIPADLTRLKKLTTGHPLIMGRKTYESIGRPLPKRTNIVISRQPDYDAPGCMVVSSLDEALSAARAKDNQAIFIFGGAAIYAAALPHTDKLYLTLIDAEEPAAETFFPEYTNDFAVTKTYPAATHGDILYQWVDYARRTD